jgi:hypothetical protein
MPGDQFAVGVDTSQGVEASRSVAIAVNKATKRVALCFAADTIAPDELGAKILPEVQRLLTTQERYAPRTRTPIQSIEVNGIGKSTFHAAVRAGVQATEVTQTAERAPNIMLLSKRAIESGRCFGPLELAEECDECHRDNHGRFRGRKDLLMALGMALEQCEVAPYAPEQAPPDQTKIDGRAILARESASMSEW